MQQLQQTHDKSEYKNNEQTVATLFQPISPCRPKQPDNANFKSVQTEKSYAQVVVELMCSKLNEIIRDKLRKVFEAAVGQLIIDALQQQSENPASVDIVSADVQRKLAEELSEICRSYFVEPLTSQLPDDCTDQSTAAAVSQQVSSYQEPTSFKSVITEQLTRRMTAISTTEEPSTTQEKQEKKSKCQGIILLHLHQ